MLHAFNGEASKHGTWPTNRFQLHQTSVNKLHLLSSQMSNMNKEFKKLSVAYLLELGHKPAYYKQLTDQDTQN